MATVTLTLEEYEAMRNMIMGQAPNLEQNAAQNSEQEMPKKKRKVSRYQKEFGRQMKRLKALHPRTPVTSLMSRGHSATRKALGMKQRRSR